MTEETQTVKLQKYCLTLYGVYAASAVLQFSEYTVLPGLLLLTIAYFHGNSKRKTAADTPYASHLRWLGRTFWIGSGVIAPVAVLISTGLILVFTDISQIASAMSGNDPDLLMANVQNYIMQNAGKVGLLTVVTAVPTALWWLHRCWQGYVLAKEGRPVDNVTRWL